jgi:hypothetical protein
MGTGGGSPHGGAGALREQMKTAAAASLQCERVRYCHHAKYSKWTTLVQPFVHPVITL